MALLLPITLVGDNLGKRHKYLNSTVDEAYKKCEEFDVIKILPEKSPIDRLFKIDLASKIKNVDYIIQNLKDDDMLYVSRALKATWLLDKKYEEIINPEYLEDQLYPEMITTAVNKMQHWIHLNLNDEMRCNQFFQYYRENNFDLAIKFFLKCSKDVILNEFNKIIYKITHHHLKVLSEKCSGVAKIFFDAISHDNEVKRMYLHKQSDYFNTLRHLLKSDPEVVLNFTEKYFNRDCFSKFSAMQTKHIMMHHKDRFWKKPELYTAWLLNIQAVADSLTSEEAKDLILKLARANYLIIPHNQKWFDYRRIEPFIKRLKPEERAAFKKQVFVEKNIGEIEEDWPYKTPELLANEIEYVTIFDDRQPEPSEYENLRKTKIMKRLIKKKKGPKCENVEIMECCVRENNAKTLLDKLFDEFRFVGFGQTLYELRKRIAAESSPKNREYMMFVLISKTGGRPDSVAVLLELLARHTNEPANVRAAIIRSLVKRAQIWRLPNTSWDQLLQFGQGLGLDGKTPEADCYEGLHAVVIRSLLENGNCESDIKNAFLTHFSTLTDYSLNSSEKKDIAIVLPKMLLQLTMEKEKDLFTASYCIEKLIEVLDAYKIKLETYPGFINTLALFADKEVSHVDHLIHRLFNAKIARKQLFRFTVKLIISDESYLNALRHDANILDSKMFLECYGQFILHANRFFRKMSVYFGEENGIASKYLQELKTKPSKIHGRLLAYLLNDQIVPYLNKLDDLEDKNSKALSAAIRASASLARPSLDINAFGWKKVGAKHVGNKLSKCRTIDINHNIEELLKCKRTAKIALALSKRTTYQTEVFVKFAFMRPMCAIKSGLKLIKTLGDKVDPLIWETIKPIIQELDITEPKKRYIVKQLENIDKVPLKIKPDYIIVIYTLFLKKSFYEAMPSLCHLEIFISEINEQYLENFVSQFLQNDFTIENLYFSEREILCTCMYIRIFIKYILLCKNEEERKRRVEKYGEPFLAVLEQLIESDEEKKLFQKYFHEMLLTLKYSKVFLSTSYVSPLPIIEKIIIWMRKHFTVAEHFKTFAQLHLLMLFYKATQQAITLFPDVFFDKKRKRTEGVEIVGKSFGKFIASETKTLQEQYFDSMPELYTRCIAAFLDKFNYYHLSSDVLLAISEGIFEGEKSAHRLGIHLMQAKRDHFSDEHFEKLVGQVDKLESEYPQWFISDLK